MRVTGTVINKFTKDSVDNAAVTIAGQSDNTDFQGNFEISGLDSGRNRIVVIHRDYKRFEVVRSLRPGDDITLALTPETRFLKK